jgi:diguanylate cyclase (GGDEF)-like protein/PAS domain S-box-containing protein
MVPAAIFSATPDYTESVHGERSMEFEIPEQVQAVLTYHIAHSENGVAVFDENDRILYHNPTFAAMFGFTGHPMIGRTHDELMAWMFHSKAGTNIEKATLQEWLDHVHSRYRSQPFRSFEVDMTDGRWLLLTEQAYPSGKLVAVCTDVTRLKTAELALRAAHAEVERLALTDELTGVPNRRHFLSRMEQEYERARRYRHPLSLAMLDLDHFKQVNDRHGHPAGDEVLKHFTGLLREQLRTEDMVGRLGGEEFALLLPETGQDGAVNVLERIRQQLAQAELNTIAPGFSYTFSSGIAVLMPDQAPRCNDWLRKADQALYQAKSEGRNRTVVFGQTT